MPRTRTTFTPATAPKGKGGSKHLKTRLKEQIGLTGWQALAEYIEGEGAARFLAELESLQGRDYVAAYFKMMEFFKPRPKAANVPQPYEIRVGFEREDEDGCRGVDEIILEE